VTAVNSPNKPRPADPLVLTVAEQLRRIENNYLREGSGPGSRFEGRLLEDVQAVMAVAAVRAESADVINELRGKVRRLESDPQPAPGPFPEGCTCLELKYGRRSPGPDCPAHPAPPGCCGYPMEQALEVSGVRVYRCVYRGHHPRVYENAATGEQVRESQ
jgi:hypothetical protein